MRLEFKHLNEGISIKARFQNILSHCFLDMKKDFHEISTRF